MLASFMEWPVIHYVRKFYRRNSNRTPVDADTEYPFIATTTTTTNLSTKSKRSSSIKMGDKTQVTHDSSNVVNILASGSTDFEYTKSKQNGFQHTGSIQSGFYHKDSLQSGFTQMGSVTGGKAGASIVGAIQMTQEQLEQLIEAVTHPHRRESKHINMTPGAATAVIVAGNMPPCKLGHNKLRRYKKWKDWHRLAENKMKFLEITEEDKKLEFILEYAGTELTTFWESEAKLRLKDIEEDPDDEVEAQSANTYPEILARTRSTMLKHVIRDKVLIDLLQLRQGDWSFKEFLAEVEEHEFLCHADDKPLTSDDLKRISILSGMNDRGLAKKALRQEYDLKQVIQAGINREHHMAKAAGDSRRSVDSSKKMSRKSGSVSSKSSSKRRSKFKDDPKSKKCVLM